MKYEIEVTRKRVSTTQGFAKVTVNGKESDWYDDRIELVDGKWQSVWPDSVFINAYIKELGY